MMSGPACDAENEREDFEPWCGVTVPPALLEEIEIYAQTHGLSVIDALRYLIVAGLAAEAKAMRSLAL